MVQNKTTKILIWLLISVIILGGIAFGLKKFVFKNSDNITDQNATTELENINIGQAYLPKDLYPKSLVEGSELAFNYDLFEPLATFNRENILIPAIATKWDNPNDSTWRFYISPKAKFSNGDTVTAEDVKFTYDYIKKDSNLPISVSLPEAEAKVGENNTIEFITKNPDPLLLNKLAWSLLIMSKKDIEANGISNKNIGSGPYILSEITDQSAKLVTNANYWKEKPKIKNVTYKLVTPENKISSLLNNEVDFVSYSNDNESDVVTLKEAAGQGKIELKKVASTNLNYFDLDSGRNKTPYINLDTNPLKNKSVRQAMALTINIDDFIKNIPDTVASNQLVSQGIFGYNPNIVRPKFNLEKAKTLMKEAGYENGFPLTIDYTDSSGAKDMLETLTKYFKDINIQITLNGLPADQFFPKISNKDTSAYFIGFAPDTKDASEILEGLIHTPTEIYGQYNLSYSNQILDKKIEDTAKTLDQKNRQKNVQEIMKEAMDDFAKLPLFQYSFNYALSSDISWKPRLDGMFRVSEMAGKRK